MARSCESGLERLRHGDTSAVRMQPSGSQGYWLKYADQIHWAGRLEEGTEPEGPASDANTRRQW